MPKGQIMTRDSLALSQGIQPPHHIVIEANLQSVGSAFHQIGELGQIAEMAFNYIRQTTKPSAMATLQDGKIFIGHGRSADWRTLSEFIQNRLQLKWDDYNREATAG